MRKIDIKTRSFAVFFTILTGIVLFWAALLGLALYVVHYFITKW